VFHASGAAVNIWTTLVFQLWSAVPWEKLLDVVFVVGKGKMMMMMMLFIALPVFDHLVAFLSICLHSSHHCHVPKLIQYHILNSSGCHHSKVL
jgi:hypothetical protein